MDKAQLDLESHSCQLIQRVLEYGTFEDWRLIRSFYGLDRIVADCKKLRTLDPACLSYICLISHTNKEDYRCYQFNKGNPIFPKTRKTLAEQLETY